MKLFISQAPFEIRTYTEVKKERFALFCILHEIVIPDISLLFSEPNTYHLFIVFWKSSQIPFSCLILAFCYTESAN